MFKADDDDDEEATLGAVRFAVMPSLVALQQMRNRLHLAYLGRKLMKWTALATGKELRRISMNIAESLEHYAEQMCTAYMLLARARYYAPKLNDVVLENIAVNAGVNIGISMKSISGVKITMYNLQESGFTPYPLLGIEKGGMAIYDAKRAWLSLLRLMIKILQQRTTFKAVEQAHRSATQRMKMLAKVVIPRTHATIEYIIGELEDRSNEDLFRMRRILGVRSNIEYELKEVRNEVIEEIDSESFVSYPELPFMGDCGKSILYDSVLQGEKNLDVLEDSKANIEYLKVKEKGSAATSIDRYAKFAEELSEHSLVKAEEPGRTPDERLYDIGEEVFETAILAQTQIPTKTAIIILKIPEIKVIKNQSNYETNIQKDNIFGVQNIDRIEETKFIKLKKETGVRTKPPPPPPPINLTDNGRQFMYQSSSTSSKCDLYPKRTMSLTMEVLNKTCINENPHILKTTSKLVIPRSLFMANSIIISYMSSESTFTVDTDLCNPSIVYINKNSKNIAMSNLKPIDFDPIVLDFVPFSNFYTYDVNLYRSKIQMESVFKDSGIDGNDRARKQNIFEDNEMKNSQPFNNKRYKQ